MPDDSITVVSGRVMPRENASSQREKNLNCKTKQNKNTNYIVLPNLVYLTTAPLITQRL